MRCLILVSILSAAAFSFRCVYAEQEGACSDSECPATLCGFRIGNEYILCDSQIQQFHEEGLAILEDFLTEEEVLSIESKYDKFMAEGSAEKYGKDFCDMSKPFNTPRDQYSVINAMLPRVYEKSFAGNAYEVVSASVASQLFPNVKMQLDYDQLLDKMPGAEDAIFAWHQDMAYWPNTTMTPDTRTVTFSLALDTTTKQNGCIHYIPGSGVGKTLRNHRAMGKDREEAHAIAVKVEEGEVVKYAEVKRGSVSIHDEYVVHGSAGNRSPGPRRTYVIAYRTAETVTIEREAGFTHSHQDIVNWDKFNSWHLPESDA